MVTTIFKFFFRLNVFIQICFRRVNSKIMQTRKFRPFIIATFFVKPVWSESRYFAFWFLEANSWTLLKDTNNMTNDTIDIIGIVIYKAECPRH